MCDFACIDFFIENSEIMELEGKRILEVGSRNVNGSVRPIIEKFFNIKEYIGVDIEKGKGVDVILSAEKIIDYFGEGKFDIVISTEMIEHVRDWRLVIKNLKEVICYNGLIYITTRSKGYPFHGYPYDFWRYEKEDMDNIFNDFKILALKKDYIYPGIFLKAKKVYTKYPQNLEDLSLYSMVLKKKTKIIPNPTNLKKRLMLQKLLHFLFRIINKIGKAINSLI